MVHKGAYTLHSISARGQIGKTHIYFVQNGVQQRKPYTVPTNPQTVDQQANRAKFANSVSAWQAESQAVKDTYNLRASRMSEPLEGFNLYIREFMKGIIP